jgi:hypothetical protein
MKYRCSRSRGEIMNKCESANFKVDVVLPLPIWKLSCAGLIKRTTCFFFGLLIVCIASQAQAVTLWSDVSRAVADCNAAQANNPPTLVCECYPVPAGPTGPLGTGTDVALHKKCIDGTIIRLWTLSLAPEGPTQYFAGVSNGLMCNPGEVPYYTLACCDIGAGNYGLPVTTEKVTYCDNRTVTSTRAYTAYYTRQTCSETVMDLPNNCRPTDTVQATYNHVCRDNDVCCIDLCGHPQECGVCCLDNGGGS